MSNLGQATKLKNFLTKVGVSFAYKDLNGACNLPQKCIIKLTIQKKQFNCLKNSFP